MPSKNFPSALESDLSVTIIDGQTTSNAIDVFGTSVVGFRTDAEFDGTGITFLTSDDLGGTYLPLHRMTDGVIVSGVVALNRQNATNPYDFMSVRFLKIVSNAAQSGSDTVIKIVNRRLS